MTTSATVACTVLLAFSIGAVVAGNASVLRPSVGTDREYTLAPGETASVEDTGIGVRFAGVQSDSRCPVDVNCIHAGNAQVRITVMSGKAQRDYEVHTGGAPVHHGDLAIVLVELVPHPHSSRAIDPRDYRATLRVTR